MRNLSSLDIGKKSLEFKILTSLFEIDLELFPLNKQFHQVLTIILPGRQDMMNLSTNES